MRVNIIRSSVKAAIIITIICVMQNSLFAQKNEFVVAMAQILCIDSDRSGNLVRIENAIAEAKDSGAEIICFPETSIYGWVNPIAHKEAGTIPGKDSNVLCELAGKYGVYVAIGLAEKDGDDLFDSVILINNKGEIILKHRKINVLGKLMDPPYTPGKSENITTTETEYGRIGLLICADSFKEEILSKMHDLDPDLLIIPYGWAATEDMWPDHGDQLMHTVQSSAIKIGCTVIGTDLVGMISNGEWTGFTYGGQSVASDSKGNILARGVDRDSQIILLKVNFE